MSVDERALLQAWAGGDRRAGEQLFARYYRPLTRFFVNKVRSLDEVEELVQRSFVAIVESAPRFRGQSSVRTWIFAIARNLLRQFYAARHRGHEALGETSVADLDAPGPSTLVGGKAEQRLLLTALRHLPLEIQVMLELFYWEDMTSAEIGEVLGIPAGTARSQLRKARVDLEGLLVRLADSPELLASTNSGLEGWAKGLREAWGI